MEQNLDNKISLKSRIINFYRENKIKIQILVIGILISLISIVFFQIYKDKKNNQVSEGWFDLIAKNLEARGKELWGQMAD